MWMFCAGSLQAQPLTLTDLGPQLSEHELATIGTQQGLSAFNLLPNPLHTTQQLEQNLVALTSNERYVENVSQGDEGEQPALEKLGVNLELLQSLLENSQLIQALKNGEFGGSAANATPLNINRITDETVSHNSVQIPLGLFYSHSQ